MHQTTTNRANRETNNQPSEGQQWGNALATTEMSAPDRAAEQARVDKPEPVAVQPIADDKQARDLAKQWIAELNQSLANGRSDTLKQYLSYIAKFHNYSVSNSLLISFQCPAATRVAGYEKWKQMGRQVKRGEKGIAIWSPIMSQQVVYEKDEAGETQTKKLRKRTGYKLSRVFDISQTTGNDEEIPKFTPLLGQPGDALPKLEKLIDENNITLVYDYPAMQALGTSEGGRITIRPDLNDAEKFAVGVHELAHELLHQVENRKQRPNKTARETEAEATAFVVLKAFGIDSTQRSSDYISLYHGDEKALKDSLTRIQRTASKIIRGLTRSEERQQEEA